MLSATAGQSWCQTFISKSEAGGFLCVGSCQKSGGVYRPREWDAMVEPKQTVLGKGSLYSARQRPAPMGTNEVVCFQSHVKSLCPGDWKSTWLASHWVSWMSRAANSVVPSPQRSNSVSSLGLAALPDSDPENAQKNDCSEMHLQGEAFSPGGEDVELIPRGRYFRGVLGLSFVYMLWHRGSHFTSHPVSSKQCLLLVLHKPCASSAEEAWNELGAIKLLAS